MSQVLVSVVHRSVRDARARCRAGQPENEDGQQCAYCNEHIVAAMCVLATVGITPHSRKRSGDPARQPLRSPSLGQGGLEPRLVCLGHQQSYIGPARAF